jgi:hypothetical protein
MKGRSLFRLPIPAYEAHCWSVSPQDSQLYLPTQLSSQRSTDLGFYFIARTKQQRRGEFDPSSLVR